MGARSDDDGQLAIDGQDLGGHPFCDEYEYFIRISPEHVDLLRSALDLDADADVLAAVKERGAEIVRAGEYTWLRDHEIPFEFNNWMGFDWPLRERRVSRPDRVRPR